MRRRARAGGRATRRPGLARAGRGAGAPDWPQGGPFGFPSWFGARGVLFIIIVFVTARPAGGRARRAPRRYWGAGAAAGALLACGTTAGRRAAILSPWLLSLGGGGADLRHRPDGPGRGGSRGSGLRGPPVVLWAPMGVPAPCQRPEALLERCGGRCSGRATILPASAPPTPQRAPCLPRPSSRQYFVLPPAGVLDVVQCGPKDERIALVFALSAELIGGWGEKLNMRFLLGGGARDSSGPD